MARFPALQSLFAHILGVERGRLVLFTPVMLGVGISFYFVLFHEPGYTAPVIAMFGAVLLLIAAQAGWQRVLALCFLLAATGFVAAKWEADQAAAPVLAEALPIRTVTGTVEQTLTLPKGIKLLLRDAAIEKLAPATTPKRISVTIKKDMPIPPAGSVVRLRAGLYPPPEQAMPGAFDFARYFYFRQIGAVGFGMAPVEILSGEAKLAPQEQAMANFRIALSKRIYAQTNAPYGGLAAGFLTGETSAVPKNVYETMRQAGLTHLLAVSGFNLVVVTGLVFFSLRLFLALLPGFALHFPIKRWAAVGALIGGFFYLWLTGAPVSAERAFLMSSLLLIAIIIDRVPTPLRSIAVAAFALLLYEPHSLMTASFQLSFAAALALIAFYESKRRELHQAIGARRVIYYLSGAFMSALVAGLSTAPFILYHFNQIATYTLLANMLAAPLVSFWIMPGLLFSLACMPFGLEAWPLKFSEWGVALLLRIAERITALPGASLYVPPLTGWGLGLVAVGGLWLCLWGSHMRFLGVPLILAGLCTSFLYQPPDILISPEAKQIALRQADGSLHLWHGRRINFQNRQWLETMGEKDFTYRRDLAPANGEEGCDAQGCYAEAKGYRVSFIEDPNALPEACAESDVLIVPFDLPQIACDVPVLIDKRTLKHEGALSVRLGKVVELQAARPIEIDRLWSPPRHARENFFLH